MNKKQIDKQAMEIVENIIKSFNLPKEYADKIQFITNTFGIVQFYMVTNLTVRKKLEMNEASKILLDGLLKVYKILLGDEWNTYDEFVCKMMLDAYKDKI